MNHGWDAFALPNDAPELASGAVLGQPIMSYVVGIEARHLTRALIDRALAAGRVKVPFRCDSPGERRTMRMTVQATGDGVEFGTRIEATERRPSHLLGRDEDRADDLVAVCAWCKRMRVGTAWLELEAAAEALPLFEDARMPTVTHGICERCVIAVTGSESAVQAP